MGCRQLQASAKVDHNAVNWSINTNRTQQTQAYFHIGWNRNWKYLQMQSVPNTSAPLGIEPGPFGTLTDDATHLAQYSKANEIQVIEMRI